MDIFKDISFDFIYLEIDRDLRACSVFREVHTFKLLGEVAEEALSEVARNSVELLFFLPQLLVEFQCVVTLQIVLLLASQFFIEA